MSDTFQPGNLRNRASSWTNIAAPLSVIEWITSGFASISPKNLKVFSCPIIYCPQIKKLKKLVTQEINDLLKSSAIGE